MLDGWASKMAFGYLAAGPAVNHTARRAAVARQHRAKAALQSANDYGQQLSEQLIQVARYADALIAENADLRQRVAVLHQDNNNLRQEGANLQEYAANLKAWGESVEKQLTETRRAAEYNDLCDDVRRCLTRLQGG